MEREDYGPWFARALNTPPAPERIARWLARHEVRTIDNDTLATSPRERLLREAAELIGGDRNKSYGDPTENFGNTAALWNAQFAHLLKDGVQFSSAHIAQAQILVKMARLIAQSKRDNYLDIAGYAACGWECE